MKIAHIADVHVRNLTRHEEYKQVFEKLYSDLKEKKPDIIFLLGDIVHSKTQISPELVDIVSDLFIKLSSISTLFIVLGNHDVNLSNKDRMDSLSPIIKLIENENIIYVRKSEFLESFKIGNNKVNIGIFGCVDGKRQWNKINRKTRECKNGLLNIALYHGPITGAKTDINYTLTNDIDSKFFANWDFVFCGDIHKQQDLQKKNTIISYCGSLIQQNFGEDINKGYLLWDINDKEIWKKDFIIIENDYGFYTLRLFNNQKIPQLNDVPKKSRFRIIFDGSYSNDDIRRIKHKIELKYKPLTISTSVQSSNLFETSNIINNENINIRNENTQRLLLSEYFKSRDINLVDDDFNTIWDIHKKCWDDAYNENEETERYNSCKIKSIEFENLFSYKGKHVIDYDRLKGITGVFGQNASGKSSAVVDTLLYAIFGNTSRDISKVGMIVNNSDDVSYGCANLYFSIGSKDYVIKRKTSKIFNKHKEFVGYRSDVDFFIQQEDQFISLNGEQRTETEKIIRRIIGTIDDITTTSISPQNQMTKFIDYGSVDKKKIISKFLDIDIFDNLYNICKDKLSNINVEADNLRSLNFTNIKDSYKLTINKNIADLKNYEKEKNELNLAIVDIDDIMNKLSEQIYSNIDIIDISKIKSDYEYNKNKRKDLSDELENITNSKKVLIKEKEQLEEYTHDNNEIIAKIKENDGKIIQYEKLRDEAKQQISKINSSISQLNKISNFFKENKCDRPDCTFTLRISNFIENQSKIDIELNQLISFMDDMNIYIKSIQDDNNELENNLKKKRIRYGEIVSGINNLIINENNTLNDIFILDRDIQILNDEISKFELNSIKINKNVSLNNKINEYKERKNEVINQLNELNEQITNCRINIKLTEEKLQNTNTLYDKLLYLEKSIDLHKLYMEAINHRGIPYDIILKTLPYINKEINKILSTAVDFSVFIENVEDEEKRNLDAWIEYPNGNRYNLSLGSGMEKIISSIAIRSALILVSSLPRFNLFIIDEGFGALDQENLSSSHNIFIHLNEIFENIIIITHLDSLKDIVDNYINVNRDDEGVSYISLKIKNDDK